MTKSMMDRSVPMPWEQANASPDTPVLLAFSGGADSVALLHLLAKRQKQDGFPLTLAHVNHGIRGEEALRDRDFCVAYAERYGLEICVLNADVPSYARERGMGLEEAARQVRYDYFARLMRERQIPLLATAHHATDQLETVLFRLARGTTLTGLCGISPARPFEGGTLVRPLLGLSKEEISAYCQDVGLPYVTDSTNADTAYARNRLRTEVIPVLETLFSGVAARTGEMCEGLREDEECLDALAEAYLANATDGALPVKSLCALPKAVARRVLKKWANDACGTLENVHVQALLHLAAGASASECVALPRAQYACVRAGMLSLSGEEPTAIASYRLPFETGETAVGDTGIVIRVFDADDCKKVHNLSTPAHTILTPGIDIIKKDVYWRSRDAGDVILRGGMHRKLRKLYAAAHVPEDLRAVMPLLCDAEGVLWAPMIGLRDGVEPAARGIGIEVLLPHGLGNTAVTL
ncbi:MAG: tRNA lysidine(34) synthetase TilS [Clostridia bacterium]|nr:tRNA lysidine(34) synthetase TilS [Clostridia bacterium]